MSRLLTVRDLPVLPLPGVRLYCSECDNSWSAAQGDYFFESTDSILRCETCAQPLRLVRRRCMMEDIL